MRKDSTEGNENSEKVEKEKRMRKERSTNLSALWLVMRSGRPSSCLINEGVCPETFSLQICTLCRFAHFADLHWQLGCQHGLRTVLFYLNFNLLIHQVANLQFMFI